MESYYSIKEVIENFDFVKVYNYMKDTDWKWAVPFKMELEVPTIDYMKQVVTTLLYNALYSNINEDTYYSETGGFRATRLEDGKLILTFKYKR